MTSLVFPLARAAFFDLLPVGQSTFDLPESVEVSHTLGGEVLSADLGERLWQGRIALGNPALPEARPVLALLNALFAAGAVAAMTGADPAAPWRGRYRSVEGGLQSLRKAGFADHVAVLARLLPEIVPAHARPGDLAVLAGADGLPAPGIVQGGDDLGARPHRPRPGAPDRRAAGFPHMIRLAPLLLVLLLLSAPAQAGPVGAAIGALVAGIKSFAAINAFTGFLTRAALSVGLSMLQRALMPQRRPRQPGIKTEVTQTGGTTPQSFVLGRHATAGQLIAPPMSYGSSGDTPRAYLVCAIAVAALPGHTLEAAMVDGSYLTLGATPDPDWGRPAEGELAGHAWIDWRDGSQTAAHPGLLAAFAADPDRPWSADMVGPGVSYAVCRFKYSRKRFNGLPAVRFQVLGLPLYDPRTDSSVGGAGAQRWAPAPPTASAPA